MPSALPTENALDKALDTYGIGTYDDMRDDSDKGEDSEEPSHPAAVPGIPDIPPNEPYIGYPTIETPQGKHAMTFADRISRNPILANFILRADSILPNDSNVNPRGVSNPNTKTKGGALNGTDVVNTTSHTELPDDGENPPARSDYYDPMQTGGALDLDSVDNIWPKEDSGAYVSSKEDSLPSATHHDKVTDNYTSPFGNSDSGFVIEDQMVPKGFPSEDYKENADYGLTDVDSIPGGKLIATGLQMNRVATDIPFVEELTSQFLKEHGKKDITRRAVTAFLQAAGHGDRQYIASDIMRCLKHNHNIIVPDVLDIFPTRTASGDSRESDAAVLASIHSVLRDLEMEHFDDMETSLALGSTASDIAKAIRLMDTVSENHG